MYVVLKSHTPKVANALLIWQNSNGQQTLNTPVPIGQPLLDIDIDAVPLIKQKKKGWGG
ncbi:MAG: hypothetical protein GX244_00190 [Firmicutes bacterium]|nr:hypothetical protein [Bacillota bacterium]